MFRRRAGGFYLNKRSAILRPHYGGPSIAYPVIFWPNIPYMYSVNSCGLYTNIERHY